MNDTNKIISSKNMLDSIGNTEELKVELSTLLKTWMMEDLLDFFMEQQIYVTILKELTPELARHIFANINLSVGAQINFYIKWNEWRNSLDDNPTSSKESRNAGEIISLNAILNSNPYGKTVKKTFQREKKLCENTRKLLCESILHYYVDNERSLSVKDAEHLAKQIVKTFPNEEMAYYFVHRPNAAPLGKLYSKYRNWRGNLSRKPKNASKQDISQHNFSDEEKSITILKQEFRTLPLDKVLEHWEKCKEAQFKSIKDLSSSTQILKEWPMYAYPLGHQLIEADFKFLHGEHNYNWDDIDSFIQIMIESVFPKHSGKFKESDNVLLTYLLKNKHADINVVLHIVFYLIQSILPFSRILNPILKKGNKRFYTHAEARNDFIAIYATEAAYKEFNEKELKTNSMDYPHISIVGSIYDPIEILLNFNTIKYKFFTLSKAIDIGFKAFHVFNMKFPEKCSAIWELINIQFYKIENENSVIGPGVRMIVKHIQESMDNISIDK